MQQDILEMDVGYEGVKLLYKARAVRPCTILCRGRFAVCPGFCLWKVGVLVSSCQIKGLPCKVYLFRLLSVERKYMYLTQSQLY